MCETPFWRLEPPALTTTRPNTYTCKVIITPRVCSGYMRIKIDWMWLCLFLNKL